MIAKKTKRLGTNYPGDVSLLCALFIMGFASLVNAGPEKTESGKALAASIEVDPPQIKLGQAVKVTIKIKGAKSGVHYDLPASLDLDPFVELSRDKKKQSSGSMQVLTLTVSCFDKLGKLTLPAMELHASTDKDGGQQQLENLTVPAVSIEVKSVLDGASEKPTPKDIADPVPVFISDYRPLVAFGLSILWIVSGFLLLRKKKVPFTATRLEELPPPRQAHEIAIEKLKQIVTKDLPRQGKFREYFARVSKTVREYLGNRYSFFALDLTSSELLEELRDRITPGLDLDALGRLLQEADLVKFANMKPTDSMISYSMDTAYGIIQATRLHPAHEQESES